MEEAALEIFLPCIESAVVLAAHYAKAAGRSSVNERDMQLGLMYSARNVLGNHIGSLYPEVYEDEEDEEDEDEEDEEDEEEWSAYEGTEDDIATKMNECAATWADWVPETPVEHALKSAVDKQCEK